MLGVDRADQLISNYRPNFRMKRVWMPIMFHGLDLMRINMYIIYNNLCDKEHQLEQKEFVLALVEKLQERAVAKSYKRTTVGQFMRRM